MSISNFFSTNLKFLRNEKGMTQLELGNKLSVTKFQVWNYEKGNAEPTMETLLKVSELFGITLDRLVKEPLDENPLVKTPYFLPAGTFEVLDDSMSPILLVEDYLVSQPIEMNQIRSGSMYLFQFGEDDYKIRYIQILSHSLSLIPENPKYERLTVPIEEGMNHISIWEPQYRISRNLLHPRLLFM